MIGLRYYWRGWLAAVAALGCAASMSFAPARAADVGPATMSADAIKALEQRLTDAGCYSGAIEGQPSTALDDAVKACPDQRPFLRIETGMHTATIERIGVDADCSLIATASEDKTVRLWSLPDGKLKRVIRLPIGDGHAGKVDAAAVSPDGRSPRRRRMGRGVRTRPVNEPDCSSTCRTARSGASARSRTSSPSSRSPPTGVASPSDWRATTACACSTARPARSCSPIATMATAVWGLAFAPDGALIASS